MNTIKNKKILYLGNQPVSNRYKRKKDQHTMRVNLKLVQEYDTGLIKLSNPVDPRYLMPKVSWLTYNEPEEHLDMVVSEINETNEMSSSKSFVLIMTLTSSNTKLSPVLDLARSSLVTIMNKLNSPTASNTTDFVADTAATEVHQLLHI